MIRRFYIETYGCQMNIADTEVVTAILQSAGFEFTSHLEKADIILFNTCSIRDKAEKKIYDRLHEVQAKNRNRNMPVIIGIIGCMAERLDLTSTGKNHIHLVAGPDNYLDLPNLVQQCLNGDKAISIEPSTTQTYENILPVRSPKTITAFVSIMRGCNNFCSYCVVPYTRGRERSRSLTSILKEIDDLYQRNYKEVTLLGQNVNSYNYKDPSNDIPINFEQLLSTVATTFPSMRIRFTTSHPKDMSAGTIQAIARYPNISRYIHLPVQSGSDNILSLMNRHYSADDYKHLVRQIREQIPDVALGTDILCGFHNETEEDHQKTLDLMREVQFDMAYMFLYSERSGTYAQKHLPDNVPLEVKKRRLKEIIDLQGTISYKHNIQEVGKIREVLIEGFSKKDNLHFFGRTPQFRTVVFKKNDHHLGDIVNVQIVDAGSATLLGEETP